MSHQILKVNVSFQSISQPQLCEQMLELMTRDDRDGLLIVTPTQRISVSSKLLQLFSPLYRDMLRDIPSSDKNPVTMFLPDYEAVHVRHLLDLLTRGRIKDKELPLGYSGDILSLAKCFGIDLREKDLIVSIEDNASEKPPAPPRIKVKNIQDLVSSPVLSESLDKEKSKKSKSKYFKELINIDDREDVEDDKGNKCAFCLEKIRRKSLKNHLKNQCEKRPLSYRSTNNNPTDTVSKRYENGKVINFDTTDKVVGDDYRDWKKCPFCLKIFSHNSFKIHEKVCRDRKSMHLLFKCRTCGMGWSSKWGLASHKSAKNH